MDLTEHAMTGSWEKMNTWHDWIACGPTFKSNKLKYSFSVCVCQSLKLPSLLQHFFSLLRFASIHLCRGLSIRLRSALWLGLCNTLILFSCAWDHCPIAWLSFDFLTDDLTFDSISFQRSHAQLNYCNLFVLQSQDVKTNPTHQPSTNVLHGWHEVFVLICYVWFFPHVVLYIMSKHLLFSFVSKRTSL